MVKHPAATFSGVQRWMRAGTPALFVGCAFIASPAWGAVQDPSRPDPSSRRIAARLRALEDEADRLTAQARSLVESIESLVAERNRHAAESARAAAEARTIELELDRATERVAALEQAEAMDEPLVASRLVALYKQGRGGYVRLFLGAETLQDMGRAARTISSLVEQNTERITARLQEMADAARRTSELEQRLSALRAVQAQADEALTTTVLAMDEREAAAAQVDRQRDTNARLLGELRSARPPIAAFKGALDWPVLGRVATRFRGGNRAAGPAGNGVMIDAPVGTPVVAVHAGVVSYAELFSGLGTLVILDHGGGISSVYGHLRSTPTRRDQRISEGEEVGIVGESGSGARPGLYFEIRADGRPTDPIQWLRPR
ncbi:MAG: peptidoglycan DD-metalloendopeptidase family protein [Vicinamibacterales bacterium]|nr:peptidoglycan DD-metalloendopeptidase family protein [Vicinamibacterales bacterium]